MPVLRRREIGFGLMFLALLAMALFLEYIAALTLYAQALTLFAAIGVGFGALFFLAGRRGVVLALTALYLAALLVLRFVELSPVKPFRAFYENVQPGMSRVDVLSELAQRFPEPGRYPRPTAGSDEAILWLTLDPTDGRYNSEVVRVEFADGLAVAKVYYPD